MAALTKHGRTAPAGDEVGDADVRGMLVVEAVAARRTKRAESGQIGVESRRQRPKAVEAGRAGNFGYVVGVDRVGHAEALRRNGADVVVTDLAELLPR